MAVTESEVRDLLDNPAATSIGSATINANINRATNLVNRYKDSTATSVQIDDAVVAVAVWLTYGSYMEGITQQLGSISIADQTKLDHLKKVAELFINQISRNFVDLDPTNQAENMIGVPPSVFKLTTSEAFSQDG